MRELIPLKDNLIFKKQGRKPQASSLLDKSDVAAGDFETIDGDAWIYSLAWYHEYEEKCIENNGVVSDVIEYDENNKFNIGEFYLWNSKRLGSFWRRGYGVKGVNHPMLFFYNIKYDAQTILKTLGSSALDELLDETSTVVNVDTHERVETVKKGWKRSLTDEQKQMRLMEISYLPKKFLRLKPIGSFHTFVDDKGYTRRRGVIDMFDIYQFYGKRLQTATKEAMADGIINQMKLDTIDTARINESEYRRINRDEIFRYALVDAEVTLELAWDKIRQFESQGMRMINPYSVASVAERSMLDLCKIPTINEQFKDPHKRLMLKYNWTGYRGGWFEALSAGVWDDVRMFDLTSAYPFVMTALPDFTKGYWTHGGRDRIHIFNKWLDTRQPYWLGVAECQITFPKSLPVHPALMMSSASCSVTPRIARGFYTGDEIQEFKKWGAKIFVNRWTCHFPDLSAGYPLKPFIEKWYNIKYQESLKKGTDDFDKDAYLVSKLGINSGYGKIIATVTDRKTKKEKIGRIFSPAWGAVITGGTRARMAEFIRLNNPNNIINIATDGILMKNTAEPIIPPRPITACYDLGEWSEETYEDGRSGKIEALLMQSGVYSVRDKNNNSKTTYRGSASLFVEGEDQPSNWFDFCKVNEDESVIKRDIHNHPNSRPYSLAEARIRGDYSLTNVFRVVDASIKALGDSNKRRWRNETPSTFGDLNSNYFKSSPHTRCW